MEATASLMYLRITPRKVRVVADLIRGKKVGDALGQLTFVEKRAALPLAKLLRSAVANADQASKGQLDVDSLWVRDLQVGQGPSLRRYMPRAMGRATKVLKKTAHIWITVTDDKKPKKPSRSDARRAGAKLAVKNAAKVKTTTAPASAAQAKA
jgi:large subunit ribosomal protein L22